MSDPQQALLKLIYAHEEAMVHGVIGCWSCPDRTFEGHSEFAAHVAELIGAEFLVVPRSDIDGTEYGWRAWPGDQVCPRRDRASALLTAQNRGAEAVERPALPWSPITPGEVRGQ